MKQIFNFNKTLVVFNLVILSIFNLEKSDKQEKIISTTILL
ncbi:putative membrane protein [Candidatus Phytoplasma solani]